MFWEYGQKALSQILSSTSFSSSNLKVSKVPYLSTGAIPIVGTSQNYVHVSSWCSTTERLSELEG